LYRVCRETGAYGMVFIRFCISARGMETSFDKASEKTVEGVFNSFCACFDIQIPQSFRRDRKPYLWNFNSLPTLDSVHEELNIYADNPIRKGINPKQIPILIFHGRDSSCWGNKRDSEHINFFPVGDSHWSLLPFSLNPSSLDEMRLSCISALPPGNYTPDHRGTLLQAFHLFSPS